MVGAGGGLATDYYDIDQGSKSSMARDIARSVRRYAIMQSNVPRFQVRCPRCFLFGKGGGRTSAPNWRRAVTG